MKNMLHWLIAASKYSHAPTEEVPEIDVSLPPAETNLASLLLDAARDGVTDE